MGTAVASERCQACGVFLCGCQRGIQQEHTHTCTETYRQHDIVLPLLPWKLTGLSLKNSPMQVCVCVCVRAGEYFCGGVMM